MNALLKSLPRPRHCSRSARRSGAVAEELNFGIISTESQQNLQDRTGSRSSPTWRKQTGLKVKPFFASDYAGVIEGMRFGKVQLAWYGNKSAMEAVDRADGEVFVQTVSVERQSRLLVARSWRRRTARSIRSTIVLKCDKSLEFRPRRSQFHLGLPGADDLRLRRQRGRSRRRASRPSPTPITRPTRWRWPTGRSMSPPTTPRTWR